LPHSPKWRSRTLSGGRVGILTSHWLRRCGVGGPLKPGFGLSGEQHFWQKRYYDFNIRDYPQFVEKLRYIHRNPVKAGLCERPEDWEWSSFRHYATGGEGRVEIESEWTARKRERAAGKLCPAVELSHSSQRMACVAQSLNCRSNRNYGVLDAPPVAVSRVGRDAADLKRFCGCEAPPSAPR
jgi:hypothetical protein